MSEEKREKREKKARELLRKRIKTDEYIRWMIFLIFSFGLIWLILLRIPKWLVDGGVALFDITRWDFIDWSGYVLILCTISCLIIGTGLWLKGKVYEIQIGMLDKSLRKHKQLEEKVEHLLGIIEDQEPQRMEERVKDVLSDKKTVDLKPVNVPDVIGEQLKNIGWKEE